METNSNEVAKKIKKFQAQIDSQQYQVDATKVAEVILGESMQIWPEESIDFWNLDFPTDSSFNAMQSVSFI